MKYIDCNASIGKWSTKDQDHPWAVEKMLIDMERCRIHGALIFSNLAKELVPSFGNKQVVEICEQYPRLIPGWVALPDQCGDYLTVNKFVQEVVDKKIKAVKIFPKLHNYLPDDRTIGRLLDALEEAAIPLFIDRGENDELRVQIDWQDVGNLCQRNPKLNIILHCVRWQGSRKLIPLLEEFPNLHIEFSAFQANRIIEFLVEKIGSSQLLFGTEMMNKSPGAAKAFLDYAEISEENRRKIASENLIRLLKLKTIPDDYEDDKGNTQNPFDQLLPGDGTCAARCEILKVCKKKESFEALMKRLTTQVQNAVKDLPESEYPEAWEAFKPMLAEATTIATVVKATEV